MAMNLNAPTFHPFNYFVPPDDIKSMTGEETYNKYKDKIKELLPEGEVINFRNWHSGFESRGEKSITEVWYFDVQYKPDTWYHVYYENGSFVVRLKGQ